MEEVDGIILNSLKECGCDFAEDANSLAEFSTENVVEAAVRCLRIIQPDLKVSHSLPPGMSARFRIGTALADACRNAGYRGDIGYQTFLYSSEADIRRLFMFLVEKLPRKKDEAVEQPSDKGSAFHCNIAGVLKSHLSSMWIPSYCKKNGVRWSGTEFSIESAKGMTSFQADHIIVPQGVGRKENTLSKEVLEFFREKLPFIDEQLRSQTNLTPSLMERNAAELSRQQEWEEQLNSGKLGSQVSPEDYRRQDLQTLEQQIASQNSLSRRLSSGDLTVGGISLDSSFQEVINMIAGQAAVVQGSDVTIDVSANETSDVSSSKKTGELLKNNKKVTASQIEEVGDAQDSKVTENHIDDSMEVEEDVPQETEEEKIKRVEKELKTELKEVIEKMERMELEVHKFQESIIKAKEDLITYEKSNKTVQEKVKLQKKTLQLLPNAEENIAKLENLIEANKKKMVSLGQQWDKHRIPLQEKFDELKQQSSQRETLSERRMKEVKLVRQRIKENTEEMKRKEHLEKQLTAQFGDMTRDNSRKSYTKRIFEIVANIRKQKQEIERALADMRSLQKEINQLEGRVERTFTAADDLFFMEARTDDSVRQAYKYLASLNINCSQLLNTVEQTGEVMREIRDLEEQVATESKKNTASNLEKITDDFKEMKKENTEMMKKLKSLTASPKPRKRKS